VKGFENRTKEITMLMAFLQQANHQKSPQEEVIYGQIFGSACLF